MDSNFSPTPAVTSEPTLAARYRAAHRNKLMLLTQLKSELPGQDEFCRVLSVETVEPSLWVTVNFLDGSRRGLRPEKIRLATEDEERFSRA